MGTTSQRVGVLTFLPRPAFPLPKRYRLPYLQRVLDIVPLTVRINIPMSEIPKKDREQYDLHIRIPADMGDKLKMLKKETGRSFADIISILIDGAKVGEYSE